MNDNQKKLMGKRIREERIHSGLSQDSLAEKLGMKRANISNYEAGRVVPPGNILLEMSRIFNVTTDYLLGLTSDPNSNISLDDDLMQIQRAKRKLTGKEKKRMEHMLEMVKLSFLDDFEDDDDDDL